MLTCDIFKHITFVSHTFTKYTTFTPNIFTKYITTQEAYNKSRDWLLWILLRLKSDERTLTEGYDQ